MPSCRRCRFLGVKTFAKARNQSGNGLGHALNRLRRHLSRVLEGAQRQKHKRHKEARKPANQDFAHSFDCGIDRGCVHHLGNEHDDGGRHWADREPGIKGGGEGQRRSARKSTRSKELSLP